MTDTATTPSILDRLDTQIAEPAENFASVHTLLPRQQRLVMAYAKHGTYVAAAEASGYSQATAKRMIETDDRVRKALQQMVDQAAINSMVSIERVIAEIAKIAFFDIGEISLLLDAGAVSHGDAITVLNEMPADARAAIASIKFKSSQNGQSVEFTTLNKQTALQDLARILSLYNDRLTVEDKTTFGTTLATAIAKLDRINHGKDQTT